MSGLGTATNELELVGDERIQGHVQVVQAGSLQLSQLLPKEIVSQDLSRDTFRWSRPAPCSSASFFLKI